MAGEHTERDDFQDQMEDGSADEGQALLFDKGKSWQNHWKGMPEYLHEDQTPFRSLLVHFASQQDLDEFLALVDQTVTERTKYLWYPELKHATFMNKGWRGANGDDEHEHDWNEVTTLGETRRRYVCGVDDCDAEIELDARTPSACEVHDHLMPDGRCTCGDDEPEGLEDA